MKISLYLRDDHDLPLGKTLAQCAHAMNRVFIDRMIVQYNDGEVSLIPTQQAREAIIHLKDIDIDILRVPHEELISLVENSDNYVVDHGKTCFDEPTLTIGWTTEGLGKPVPPETRYATTLNSPQFKQPILVNRANKDKDPDQVLKEGAITSTQVLLDAFDLVTGQIDLIEDDPLLNWIANGMGKTVIGVKKESHYIEHVTFMEQEESNGFVETFNEQGPLLMAYYPVEVDRIERYTRTSRTQLLNSL
ncbi:hypothetical protein AB6D11_19190 [Vibrio splendidus]